MPPLGRALRTLAIVLLAGAALTACTKQRGAAPFDPEVGHAGDFLGQHFTLFRADGGSCILCHGIDLEGGISKVSCYTPSRDGQACHAGGPGGHPIGWAAPPVHGATAKAPPGAASGFASCRRCHGEGFEGGSTGLPCFSCHGVPAPHPRGPWRGNSLSHTTTSPGNAEVCAACHDGGRGLPPGCFNNSLCHGEVANHPSGWASSAGHGRAAKSGPGSMTGFEVCTNCHGSNFQGDSGRACGPCHGVDAPHPRPPWRSGVTHADTNQGNAPICARCHDNRSNNLPPGCFNNSLCHGSAAGHPAGWDAPNQHGAAAKAAPGAGTGFASCRDCHGSGFNGGSSGQSCFPCHGWSAPHARSGWEGGAASHRQANEGNAVVCADCHRHNPGPAGCFNNTLCHAGSNHPTDWANVSRHGSAAVNSPGFANCQSCHGNNFGGGTSGQSCFPCHGWNAPHGRTGWDNGGSRHRQGGNQPQANICAICHRSRSGTAGCFNNTLCHGND